MKVCTKCNRVLGDNETQCPHCAAQARERGKQPYNTASLGAAKEAEAERTKPIDYVVGMLDNESNRYSKPETEAGKELAAGKEKRIFRLEETAEPQQEKEAPTAPSISATQVFTIEIPLGEVLEELERKKKAEEIAAVERVAKGGALEPGKDTEDDLEDDLEDDREEDDNTAEFSFKRPQPASEQAEAPTENAGLIEQELAMRTPEPKPVKKSINKFGVTLVAVGIIMVLVFATLLVMKIVRPSVKADEGYYLSMLTGTWVSDEFKFTDAAAENDTSEYVELLTIKSDATFTVQYLVVNNSIPNGYLAGEWEVVEEFSGTVEILPDNATLVLVYELGGEKVAFIRDIIEISENEVVLREYGEDEKYHFDMKLKRVK